MTKIQSVGPITLRSDYQLSTDEIMLLQSYANLLREQMPLDLPVDSGLAFEVAAFQEQMKDKAGNVFNRIVPNYIRIVSMGANFYALWEALLRIDLPLLQSADSNEKARKTSAYLFRELSDQASKTNQVASAVEDDLRLLNNALKKTDSKFQTALDASIAQLGATAVAQSSEIDELKALIKQNINDIVSGAQKAGAATSELLIGMLTMISEAKVDNGDSKDPEKEGKDKDKDKDKEGSEDKKSLEDKKDGNGKEGGGGSKPPSVDFVVSAIKGASEGVAETAQARADLNANNEKLVVAYQNLAQANALIAVAKVVSVQNDLFISTMKEALQNIASLSDTWGKTPITPPGSGISLEFANFAHQIEIVSGRQDVNQLVRLVNNASTDWDLLNEELVDLKRAMVGFDA
ncbi:MAG: HBL/NHE enterotoxin family protein [Chloroflexi bacterium]|nr:HBL/NHE enterotoxin family protein [Chloroflexota bacterium]